MTWGRVDEVVVPLVGPALGGWAAVLATMCNGRTGVGRVSVRALAAKAGRTPGTAKAAIDSLIAAGLVHEQAKGGPGQPRTLVCLWITNPKSCPQARDGVARARATWSRASRDHVARFSAPVPLSLSDSPERDGDVTAYIDAGMAGIAAARAALDGSPRARWRARTDPTKRAATIAAAPRNDPRPLPGCGEAVSGA